MLLASGQPRALSHTADAESSPLLSPLQACHTPQPLGGAAILVPRGTAAVGTLQSHDRALSVADEDADGEEWCRLWR